MPDGSHHVFPNTQSHDGIVAREYLRILTDRIGAFFNPRVAKHEGLVPRKGKGMAGEFEGRHLLYSQRQLKLTAFQFIEQLLDRNAHDHGLVDLPPLGSRSECGAQLVRQVEGVRLAIPFGCCKRSHLCRSLSTQSKRSVKTCNYMQVQLYSPRRTNAKKREE